MEDTDAMHYRVVRTSYDNFARFLREQENRFWRVQSQYLAEDLPYGPATVDELMYAIRKNGDPDERVYVFNPYSESGDPLERAIFFDEAIPTVGVKELENYVIKSRSDDFLWFECSLDMASNKDPAILTRSNTDR